MSTNPGFPSVPQMLNDEKEHRRQMAQAIDRLNRGKFNATLDVTLAQNATATTISDARIGYFTGTPPVPTSLHASQVASSLWFSNFLSGSMVINHASLSTSDSTFRLILIG